jgi:hypothetical protein
MEMPNTKTDWKTRATVHDPERRAFWEEIFGGDEVPVVSFLPKLEVLPGYDRPQMCYMLDLKALSDEQRHRLVGALADKFGMSPEFVADNLEEHGVPILASDVSVSSTDRALVMGAIL